MPFRNDKCKSLPFLLDFELHLNGGHYKPNFKKCRKNTKDLSFIPHA